MRHWLSPFAAASADRPGHYDLRSGGSLGVWWRSIKLSSEYVAGCDRKFKSRRSFDGESGGPEFSRVGLQSLPGVKALAGKGGTENVSGLTGIDTGTDVRIRWYAFLCFLRRLEVRKIHGFPF